MLGFKIRLWIALELLWIAGSAIPAQSPPGITGHLWFYNNTQHQINVHVNGGGKVLPVKFLLKPGGTWKVSTVERAPAFVIDFLVTGSGRRPGRAHVNDGRGHHVGVFRDTATGAVELFMFRPADH